MASWSPSQSAPLTVSYMCQRQSSSPILPSAAAMPPCAATVCERVGNTLVMQAVRRPGFAAADHGAQAGAAGADHDHVVAVILDRIGAAVDRRRAAVRFSVRCHGSDSERELEDGEGGGEADGEAKNVLAIRLASLSLSVVHVVDDDLLHADPHVIGGVDDEQQHDDGDERRAENLHDRGVAASEQRDDDDDQRDASAGCRRPRSRADARNACVPEWAAPSPRTRRSGVRICVGAFIAGLPWRDSRPPRRPA